MEECLIQLVTLQYHLPFFRSFHFFQACESPFYTKSSKKKSSPRNCYRNRGAEKQTKKGSNASNLSNRLAYCSALCRSLSASHQNRHFSSLFSFSGNPFVFVPQPPQSSTILIFWATGLIEIIVV